MTTEKDLEEFKELFRTHFHKELTNAEALEKMTALLTMMRIVYKPITQEQYDEAERFREKIREQRRSKATKILIAGIPGTGKTTVGNILAQNHNFEHIDLESEAIQRFAQDPDGFINLAHESENNIVITWGFVPDETQTNLVLAFKNNGFKLFWFDGDREASRREFKKRETVPEDLYNLQMKRIDDFEVIKKIDPIVYNTFTDEGNFKNTDDIILEILTLAK